MKPTKSPAPGTTSPYDNFYDREAEEAVCGAIILESQAIYEVIDILTPDMFGGPQCANIYAAAIALYDSSVKIDMITLLDQIQKAGHPYDEYAIFITGLFSRVSSSANIVQHALYIKESYIRRQFVSRMHTLLASAADKTIDIADLLDDAGKAIDTISTDLAPTTAQKPFRKYATTYTQPMPSGSNPQQKAKPPASQPGCTSSTKQPEAGIRATSPYWPPVPVSARPP